MLLVNRRLGPQSDHVKNNAYHPQCTAHLHPFCVVSRSCKFNTMILGYPMSILALQTWNLLVLLPCFTFLKIMKRWSRCSSKAEVQHWDTCPEPTELAKADIPYSMEPVLWNEELWKAKEVENCLCTSVVFLKKSWSCFTQYYFRQSAQIFFRSSCGHVGRTGLENFWLFSKHGETCCEGETREHGLSPTDKSTTTNSLLINEQARWDLLREHKRIIANLPDDLRLIRLCSDAGFMKTVARGQYFVTLDEAELAKLNRSCRESTHYFEMTN